MSHHRNRPLTEADRRRELLKVLGFVQGAKMEGETRSLIRGLLIWRFGLPGIAGKSPLMIASRKIRLFINCYAPVKYQDLLNGN